jgi:predicted dinucleotide-binding enzyme
MKTVISTANSRTPSAGAHVVKAFNTIFGRVLAMAATLESLGLMMIGLAKNGAGSWDIALNVDIS